MGDRAATRKADKTAMRVAHHVVLVLLSAIAAFASLASPASADGPHEPNETAATAAGPLIQDSIAAALETPQDVDWYALHPEAPRQIGVLATLAGSCPRAYGRVSIEMYDADAASYALPVASIALGSDYSGGTVTAGRFAFTSVRGHRYLLKVRQSGCDSVPYSLAFAHTGALGMTLANTAECQAAIASVTRHRRIARRRRAAARRARGARRKALRARYRIERQAIVVAESAVTSACARRALSGYPWA